MSALPTRRICAVEQRWRLIGEQGYPAMLDGEYRQEVEYLRKDGSRFWGLLNGTCIDPSQAVKDYLFAIADITDQKATEAALGKAKEAVDAANQAKSAFLATMSHEIRTPMNAILGLLELVGLTRLDTEQEKMVGVIRDAADSLLRIINDILDVSRIEAGQMQIQPEPASLAEVIRAVVNSWRWGPLGTAPGANSFRKLSGNWRMSPAGRPSTSDAGSAIIASAARLKLRRRPSMSQVASPLVRLSMTC